MADRQFDGPEISLSWCGRQPMRASSNGADSSAGLAPSHALELAIMMSLNPGAYTVILQGADGGQGIGIFAVYGQ